MPEIITFTFDRPSSPHLLYFCLPVKLVTKEQVRCFSAPQSSPTLFHRALNAVIRAKQL
jgi:hypothetical protein